MYKLHYVETLKVDDYERANQLILELAGVLDNVQGEYLNQMLQQAYYDMSLYPDISFTQLQEYLSQAEYDIYNRDFFMAYDRIQECVPAIQEHIERYQEVLKHVEDLQAW